MRFMLKFDFSQDWNCTIDGKKIEEKRNIKDKFDNLTENSEIVLDRMYICITSSWKFENGRFCNVWNEIKK